MRKNTKISVLVTAGGTQEDIDTVRSITNHATGRLGSLIADAFSQAGANVTYLCSETAARPSRDVFETITIRNVAGLVKTLDELLQNRRYDCVIHSMAVSDFTPHATATLGGLIEIIRRESCDLSTDETTKRILSVMPRGTQQKISSGADDLILLLEKTPKVINRIKALQPGALLIGFKLLSGCSEAELFRAGLKLIESSKCDFVLANDLSGISEEKHKAFLMDENGILQTAETKQDIAQMIYERAAERIEINK